MDDTAPAAIGGNRLLWADLPGDVRAHLDRFLGSPVVHADSQAGGFSPGLASRLLLADGRRAFLKAISSERSPMAYAFHRSEARVADALPNATPAPRLLGAYDSDDWIALAFADIDGRQPEQPWTEPELHRVLAALGDLADVLTPSPIDDLPRADQLVMDGWQQVAADPELIDRLAEIDQRAASRLDTFVRLEQAWPDVAAGDTMLHFDIRADNVLLTDDQVMFVDWPHACIGARYLDLLFMLPSAVMHGTEPEPIIRTHPTTRDVDSETINAALATFAGYAMERSMRPADPLLPTVRDFQRAQGLAVLRWLAERGIR